MIRFFMVLLAGLLTTQGLQAETRVYNFTNVKTNTDTTTGLVADNGDWNFNKDVTVSNTGGINFTLPTKGCTMESSNDGFYDIKKVTINAKVAESGNSVTFGAGISSETLTSTTFTDIVLCPTDYHADGRTLAIVVSGQGTVYMNSITVEWTTPGSISYATTTVNKTFGDAAFTNPLTKVGDGSVSYSSSEPGVATIDNTGEVTITGTGNTEITATVTDSENYTYATNTASYTLKVASATMTVTAEGWSGTYDGNPHGITVTAPTGATVKYGTTEGTYNLNASPTCTNVGTLTVYYQVTKDNYTAVTGSKTVSITNATMTVTAEGWSGTYDGNAHSITVTAPTGATVKYGTVDGTYDLTTNPTYTEAGTHTVYYQVTKDNYTAVTGSETVSITEATMTVTAEGWSGTYDGNSHGITVTAPTGATVKYGTADGTYDLTTNPTYTEVGTYTVYYQVTKDNYTPVTGSETVTITEATMTVTAEGWNGTFDGNPHGITVTAPTGATVKYGTTEGTYTLDASPTYTNFGVYTVYYQVTQKNYTTITGSETVTITAMAPVVNDNTEAEMTLDMDFSSNTEVQTTALTNVVIENILYTLNDQQTTGAEDDGYDSNSGMLVLNTVVTDDDINKATTMQPGTTAYAETFKGLTMILPQGFGEIEVSSFQEEGHALCVKIGDNEPVVLSHEETLTDIIPYAVSEATYVYVYHTLLNPSANIRHRGPKTHVSTGLNGMKVHASVIDNPPAQSAYKLLSDSELEQIESTSDGGIVIDDSAITDLQDYLFISMMEAGTEIAYIDLRNTSVSGMTVDRTKGAFRNVPATTFIYLPAGNTSKSPNVVIGSVCADLQLTDDGETGYQQLFDFMATSATYHHTVRAGESTTIYLPFAVQAQEKDGVFYEFNGITNNGVAIMQAVEQPLEPNTPYLFRAGKEDITSFTAKSVAVKKVDNQRAAAQLGIVMKGTYEKILVNNTETTIFYSLEDNGFTMLRTGSSIPPFSVYMISKAFMGRIGIQWSDDATAIGATAADQKTETGWYTLSGQKLDGKPAVKGLYIRDGKKMVVK